MDVDRLDLTPTLFALSARHHLVPIIAIVIVSPSSSSSSTPLITTSAQLCSPFSQNHSARRQRRFRQPASFLQFLHEHTLPFRSATFPIHLRRSSIPKIRICTPGHSTFESRSALRLYLRYRAPLPGSSCTSSSPISAGLSQSILLPQSLRLP